MTIITECTADAIYETADMLAAVVLQAFNLPSKLIQFTARKHTKLRDDMSISILCFGERLHGTIFSFKSTIKDSQIGQTYS